MSKITQKQLVERLGMLKEIKPRREWAVLLKSQILAESQVEARIPAQKISFSDIISNFKFQISNSFSKKLAYATATLVFMIIGVLGFAQHTMPGDLLFPIKKISEQSQAALSGQTILKQEATVLSNRINDLAQVAKEGRKENLPSAISEINANVSELAKNLKENSADAETLKEIALSLKTLATVPGTDFSENAEVIDLYKSVVEGQIADLEKSTLTEEQEESLKEAKDLYGQEKYTDALEIMLLINN